MAWFATAAKAAGGAAMKGATAAGSTAMKGATAMGQGATTGAKSLGQFGKQMASQTTGGQLAGMQGGQMPQIKGADFKSRLGRVAMNTIYDNMGQSNRNSTQGPVPVNNPPPTAPTSYSEPVPASPSSASFIKSDGGGERMKSYGDYLDEVMNG